MNPLYHRFEEDLKLCGRSDGTRAQYLRHLQRCAAYFRALNSELREVSDEDLRYYLLHHLTSGSGPAARKMAIAALKFFFETTLRQHHRLAWLARESSKPRRGQVERWTVQASAEWSLEHLQDEPSRVEAKLLKAFAEITGIRAQPNHTEVHRWLHAKTVNPLGKSHLWEAKSGLGVCGDWCLGHRVEDAFVSGLEMALKLC